MAADRDRDEPNPLGTGAVILRLGAIGAVLLCSAAAFAYTAGWLSPERLTQTKLVAGFEAADGRHPGFRRNHAKGVCATGRFESSGNAASLSKAAVFAPGRVPVVARVNLAGGMPFQADKASTVRGLALQLKPAGGQEWRTGMINIPVFPFATAQAFYEQAQAVLPDPATGKADPAKMKAFVASHPDFAAAGALVGKRPITSAFADTTYNGLHTFTFVAGNGTVTPVRWSAVAVDPATPAPAPAEGAAPADPNALFDAFIARVAQRPVQWRLVVSIAADGDPLDDPSKPWPADRPQVEAGTITLDRVEAEDGGPCTTLNFDPLVLPDGIEASNDEILATRSAAYARSFRLREGEAGSKPPSAVTPPAVAKGGRP